MQTHQYVLLNDDFHRLMNHLDYQNLLNYVEQLVD